MEFHSYTTFLDCAKHFQPKHLLGRDPEPFYRVLMSRAARSRDGRTRSQAMNELDWERLRRPYYNVFPGIIPLLTRLNLDLDTTLIRLPMDSLCIRFPKDPTKNPLKFDWKGEQMRVRAILMGDIGGGMGISLHFDIGQHGPREWPLRGCCNFARQPGLTVEQALATLVRHKEGKDVVWLPAALMADCVRLCCTLCLLDNDPSVISPDVLAEDRRKYDDTSDQRLIDRAHRRGKVGWNIGRHVEQIPHYRRPHMALFWTGEGREIPKIKPRNGCIVHRDKVEDIPTGFEGETDESVEPPPSPPSDENESGPASP